MPHWAGEAIVHRNSTFGIMHRVLDTWVDIDARPQEVWDMLVDFGSWESWNRFSPVVEGELRIGNRMRIRVVPPGMKPMVFEPEVYVVKPYEKIIWGGSFLRVVYRGDHTFLLEPLPGGNTRFRQVEQFRGPMVLLMGGMIRKTEVGYHQMNLAFKKYVEGSRRDRLHPGLQ